MRDKTPIREAVARRPRAAPQRVKPLTLGDLARGGVKHVVAECDWCRHEGKLALELLIEKAGADAAYREVARHFRCSVCGWAGIAARPVWPGDEPPSRRSQPARKPSPLPPLSECRALVKATSVDGIAQRVERRAVLIHALRERWPELTASAARFVIQTIEAEDLPRKR